MRDTAAHHLVTRVPTAQPLERAGEMRSRLVGNWESAEAVYLVDDGTWVGTVPLRALLAAGDDVPLASIALHQPPRAHPDEAQERVAHRALRHGVHEIPVVDHDGRLVGVVPGRALLRVLREEHVADLHRMAGIAREGHEADIDEPPARRLQHRLPWLVVGLLGSLGAAGVMGRFEAELDANVAVAYFVPAIVYLADAVGTQTETISVRALSLGRTPVSRMLPREVATGILLGASLAALIVPAVWLFWGNLHLALAVASAVLVACAIATSVGLLFPWALHRLGRDPALGSGPLATIIQDVLSLLVYFGCVELFL
ncbi:MAG: magnesium transporter [Deltaproteobacteria bacterium]|nr:magnesium transporter [Deltaproteobacteria bacterium]